jgi:hypothetical protein
MPRIVIAGLAAGLVIFLWEAIAHMALPFGQMGISQLENEVAVRDALQATIGDARGLYLFPWVDFGGPEPAPGVAGMLMYHPAPADLFNPLTFVWELGVDLAQGVALALVLSVLGVTGIVRRAGYAALIGFAAVLGTTSGYTIWYGFPLSYLIAQFIVLMVGYALAGGTIAFMLRVKV